MSQGNPASAEFLSPEEVAELLGLTKRVILGAIRRNEIPALKIGNRFRIPRSFVDQARGTAGCA